VAVAATASTEIGSQLQRSAVASR